MSVKGENQNKVKQLVKLSANHFLTPNNKLREKNLWLTAKTKANFKPGLKMKVA